MIAWRWWKVVDGHLVAPLAGDVLAADGVATADPPPTPYQAGIHFYPRHQDVVGVVAKIRDLAVTAGRTTDPVYADWRAPLYMVDGLPVVLPSGARCASYRVIRAYSDEPLTGYTFPVVGMEHLRDAS